MIVDTGVHLWRAEQPGSPWPEGRESPQRGVPFEAAELLGIMDANGVDRAVVVPPTWVGETNADALAWAAEFPDRLGVMGRFAMAPENVGELEGWLEQPGMLGIRLSYPASFGDWLDLDRTGWFWEAAQRFDVPLMILCQNEARRIEPIARRFPDLTLIIDHLAIRNPRLERAAGREVDPFERFDDFIALAKYPNVSAKLSSLPYYSADPFPYPDLMPHIERAVDAFGTDRLMWGSDISRMNLMDRPPDYAQILGHLREFLRDSALDDVLGRTPARILRWP
jgi:L-fuconolactonase